ncbi:DUF445 family protein [Peptostreptococcaceae bacterium AGR-M142]
MKYIIDLVLGGMTGYITNKIAIKMLFKEYMGVGGVILKTREEFIENLSYLIEKDLINHKTLERELNKAEFKNIAVDIFNSIKMKKLEDNRKIKDLKGTKNTLNNLVNYSMSINENLSNNIYDDVISKVNLENILDENIIKKFASKVHENLVFNLENEDEFKSLFNLFKQQGYKNLNEFLGKNIVIGIKESITGVNLNINKKEVNLLKEYLITEFEKQFKNNNKFLEDINKLYIRDFLKNEEIDRLKEDLQKLILENETDLKKNFKSFYEDISKSEKNICEYISMDEKKFERRALDLKESIKMNSNEFVMDIEEDILNGLSESIESNFSSDFDLFGINEKIKSMAKEFLIENEEFNISNMINEFLNFKIDEYDETKAFVDYIKSKKIKDLIVFIECEFDINLEDKLFDFIKNTVLKLIEKGDLLDIKLSRFIDIKNIFENIIVDFINKNINMEFVDIKVKEFINLKLDSILNKTFTEMGEEKVNSFEKYIFTNTLKSNKESFCDFAVNKFLNSKVKIQDLMNAKENIKSEIKNFVKNEIEGKVNNISEKTINDIFNNLNDKNIEEISTVFVSTLKEELPNILEGKVKKVVKSNMKELEDEKLQTMLEDFMGKELKPINTIGAIFGGLVGIALSKYDISNMNMLSSFFVYSLVGWFTNFIALKMIFKPYETVKLGGLSIFPQGVISKQKPRFAKSMSSFVSKQLIKEDKIKSVYKNNIDYYKNYLEDYLKRDNYFYLNNHFISKRDILAEKFSNNIINNINLISESKKQMDMLNNISINMSNNINKENLKFTINSKLTDINNIELKDFKLKDLNLNRDFDFEFKNNSFNNIELNLKEILKSKEIKEFKISNFDFEDLLINNIESIRNILELKIKLLLNNNKNNLKENILKIIKNKMGMLYELSAAFIDIEDSVLKILNTFIDEKVDEILFNNQDKLEKMILKIVKDNDISLKAFEIEIDLNEYKDRIIPLKNVLFNNINISNYIDENSLNKIKNDMIRELKNISIDEDIKNIFIDKIFNISLDEFTKNIDSNEIQLKLKEIGNKLKEDNNYLDIVINNLDNQLEIKQIYTSQEIEEIYLKLVNIIKEDNNLRIILKNNIQSFIEKANDLIDNDFKQTIIFDLIELLLIEIANNWNQITENIDFENIIETEINEMHPREIEDLFNSFAKKYFTRLELYGLLGGFLGLISVIIKKLL